MNERRGGAEFKASVGVRKVCQSFPEADELGREFNDKFGESGLMAVVSASRKPVVLFRGNINENADAESWLRGKGII